MIAYLLGREENVGSTIALELGFRLFVESENLLHHVGDVVAVDEGEGEFHGSAPDRDVGVFEAVDDGAAMSLDGVGVDVDDFEEGAEGDVANVFVVVQQEPAEDVDGEDAKARLRLDVHDGQHGFVEDGVADVLRSFRVGGDLGGSGKYIRL